MNYESRFPGELPLQNEVRENQFFDQRKRAEGRHLRDILGPHRRVTGSTKQQPVFRNMGLKHLSLISRVKPA